jgi:hypothetical protein
VREIIQSMKEKSPAADSKSLFDQVKTVFPDRFQDDFDLNSQLNIYEYSKIITKSNS